MNAQIRTARFNQMTTRCVFPANGPGHMHTVEPTPGDDSPANDVHNADTSVDQDTPKSIRLRKGKRTADAMHRRELLGSRMPIFRMALRRGIGTTQRVKPRRRSFETLRHAPHNIGKMKQVLDFLTPIRVATASFGSSNRAQAFCRAIRCQICNAEHVP